MFCRLVSLFFYRNCFKIAKTSTIFRISCSFLQLLRFISTFFKKPCS